MCRNSGKLSRLNEFCAEIFIIVYFAEQTAVFLCLRSQRARLKTYGILMRVNYCHVGMRDVSETTCNPLRPVVIFTKS